VFVNPKNISCWSDPPIPIHKFILEYYEQKIVEKNKYYDDIKNQIDYKFYFTLLKFASILFNY